MTRREALGAIALSTLIIGPARGAAAGSTVFAGLSGPIGARPDARKMKTLRIEKSGVYENLLIDGEWAQEDLVRILADNVVLRNCTIRHSRRDGVEVYGRNVRIENCHIHHLLNGTYRAEKNLDAHGITGRPLNLTVRNCEISHVSGDALQFDPSRRDEPYPWDNVMVEDCFLWTGPLDQDHAGFKRGEIPGENAFDSKTTQKEPRGSRVTFRRCLMKGWGHGAIGNGAALNLKEKVQAVVDACVFVDNDIAFRCRGTLGSAWITVRNCTVYRTSRVFRLEAGVQNLKIFHLAQGEGIGQLHDRSPGPGAGFEESGQRAAPPLAPWPWTRLAVGEVIPPGTPPSSANDRIATALATGWEGNP
ncbi:MAG: right-handed parallel beta-helix repeat-containing protein [Opitutaceae bacterium]|nr:right-handed parallel beta-helix repeat-containing protein [Opitutaceae bacterium]